MILSSLDALYHRLLANPNPITGLPRVPPYGFSEQQISFCLVLSRSGQLLDVEDIRETSEKKPRPRLLSVPRPEKRTSGVKPNFLWDKTAYVLGIEGNKDKKEAKEKPSVESNETFIAFKDLHLSLLSETTDEALLAVREFLKQWRPSHFANSVLKLEHVDANLAFKLDGCIEFVHERTAAQTAWLNTMTPDDDAQGQIGQCLVTGNNAALARLHPSIKGVWGGQSAGGSIVSFNAEAYLSLGKEQGENAPISEAAAFSYTTALNYLLRRPNGQCLNIGDASTVFWAVSDTDSSQAAEAESLFSMMLNMPSDDAQEQAKISPILEKIAQGKPLKEIAPNVAANTQFYVLGLAPNASRISIRFWLNTTFGNMAARIAEHFHDLALEPLPWREPPSIWRLLIQTAPLGKSENIPPQLAGEFLRAIITGERYPRMVLTQVVQRIRSDGDLNGIRVALIKAVLNRDYRKNAFQEEIPMGLDESNQQPSYRLGRLFAVLERIQQGALGKEINATISDRYYGTASAVPYSVFPRLLAGSKNHLSKIRKDKPGYAVVLEKDMGSVMQGLGSSFPKHFSIEQQGQFAIGYYHQKQSYFTKKDDSVSDGGSSDALDNSAEADQ
jgi:CRISPR-associated protein Csd1